MLLRQRRIRVRWPPHLLNVYFFESVKQLEMRGRLRAFSTGLRRPDVDATSFVHPNAVLGEGVTVGRCCWVGPDVSLAAGVQLQQGAIVQGRTRVGAGTVLHPFAVLGGVPQDKKHNPAASGAAMSRLEIGARCTIREHVTVNAGTSGGGGLTAVGDDCLLMAGAHVGHDCRLGNGVVMANHACAAGHVAIGDRAIIGGQAGIRQHVSVGTLAMVGGLCAVDADVIPFGLVAGAGATLAGLNLVGLRRASAERAHVRGLLSAVRYLFPQPGRASAFAPPLPLPPHPTLELRIAEVAQLDRRLETALRQQQQPRLPGANPLLGTVLDFLRSPRRRSALVMPPMTANERQER